MICSCQREWCLTQEWEAWPYLVVRIRVKEKMYKEGARDERGEDTKGGMQKSLVTDTNFIPPPSFSSSSSSSFSLSLLFL